MSENSKPWYMLAPLGLVAVLIIGWSIFWYISFNEAQKQYGVWAERAKRSGLEIECAQQHWGGYPFRVEMGCEAAHISKLGGGTDIVVSSSNLTLVTQIYTQGLIVAQFTGPSAINVNTKTGGGLSVSGTHDPALASIKLKKDTPTEVSVLIENLVGTLNTKNSKKAGSLTAAKINLHARVANPPKDNKASYDLAAVGQEFIYDGPQRDPIDGGPVTFNSFVFSGLLEQVPFPWPDQLGQTLKAWAKNKGVLDVRQLDLSRSPVRASMTGTLTAEPRGTLNGTLKGKIINLDKLLDRLVSVGKLSRGEASIAKNMFRLLSDDKDGGSVASELSVKNSKIYLGPFKVGHLPALF